jgi:hypothetical protein
MDCAHPIVLAPLNLKNRLSPFFIRSSIIVAIDRESDTKPGEQEKGIIRFSLGTSEGE